MTIGTTTPREGGGMVGRLVGGRGGLNLRTAFPKGTLVAEKRQHCRKRDNSTHPVHISASLSQSGYREKRWTNPRCIKLIIHKVINY